MSLQRDLPLDSFKPNVQVYAIMKSNSCDYDLLGHGLLSISTEENDLCSIHFLQVEGNRDKTVLVRSRIRVQNNYEKQKGSVIVWGDEDQSQHSQLALSFQGDNECDFFWRLICEKIGKNYLDISGRDTLEMPTDSNLTIILDKTKTCRDMVQYHMLNSNEFMISLYGVFCCFKQKNDKMGMGIIGRILNSILSNVDHKLVQVLFKDPIFPIILNIQQFTCEVDFPQIWKEKIKLRTFIPLDLQIEMKIQLLHRVNFYRQNILDLSKEIYLQHILMMTYFECCKDIITHLTKDNTIDQVAELKYSSNLMIGSDKLDNGEDDTSLSEIDTLRRRQFANSKMQFLMQAFIICKQIQSDNTKIKFLDKVYSSKVMQVITQYFDQNIIRSLDLLLCVVQASPQRFLDYLKNNYRQQSSNGVYVKLYKKFCIGTQDFQLSIIQILKYFTEPFKTKQNLDFFIGTFLTYIFQYCKDQKALLLLFSQIIQIVQNVQSILQQGIKSKVFDKLNSFIRNIGRDKISEIRAAKVMKRILLQNTGSNKQFQKIFLGQLNQQVVNSGFFECSMLILQKNIIFNNIISSSLLQNLKILKEIKVLTPYHTFIKDNYAEKPQLQRYLLPILNFVPQITESIAENLHPKSHQRQLDQQMEENYLMDQNIDQGHINTSSQQQSFNQLRQLRRMRQQIRMEDQARQLEQISALERLRKKRKGEQLQKQLVMQFKFQFDQSLEGNQ